MLEFFRILWRWPFVCSRAYQRAGLFVLDPSRLTSKKANSARRGSEFVCRSSPYRFLRFCWSIPVKLVTREEIRQKLWSRDTFVEFDDALNTAVRKLRAALNDSADNPRFLETVPRRGYRFIAPVAWTPELQTAAPSEAPVKRRVSWLRYVWPGVALIVAVAAVGGYRRLHHPDFKITAKDTIVLGDFSNSTGDVVFDDTLKTALNVSLRQSPFLNVLSDSEIAKALQLMTRPPSTKLTPEVAREVCQRAGSKAYLAGAIGTLGSEYVLGLKAVNCQSRRHAGRRSENGGFQREGAGRARRGGISAAR